MLASTSPKAWRSCGDRRCGRPSQSLCTEKPSRRVSHPPWEETTMAQNPRERHQTGANEGGRSDLPALAIDVLPDLCGTWMRFSVDMTQQWMKLVQPWSLLADLQPSDLLPTTATPTTEPLAHDPLLKSIEQVWKASPLHVVIPVDWAGIAWALRTVWLRSFTHPDVLQDFSELTATIWQRALDVWSVTVRHWCGEVSPDPVDAAKSGDKRFAAPEWHSNALYRTVREVYLLASNWLLKQ